MSCHGNSVPFASRIDRRLLALLAGTLLGVLVCGPAASAGTIIQVTNTQPANKVSILSDLIAYDKDGNKKTILKPGDKTDDVNIIGGGSRLFDAGFEVKKYIISQTREGNEFETLVFNVKQILPKAMAMLDDPTGLASVFLAIDYDQYNFDAPAEGTILSFTNGLNDSLAGWFVGTSIDFDTGAVSNAYTGEVVVASIDFQVLTVVPEPPSLFGAVAGLLAVPGVMLFRRRRARAGRQEALE